MSFTFATVPAPVETATAASAYLPLVKSLAENRDTAVQTAVTITDTDDSALTEIRKIQSLGSRLDTPVTIRRKIDPITPAWKTANKELFSTFPKGSTHVVTLRAVDIIRKPRKTPPTVSPEDMVE